MKHIIHLEADSYPDLRDQIRQLVVDHGLVMVTEGGLTGNAGSVSKSEDKPAPEKKSASKPAPEKERAAPAEEVVAAPAPETTAETKPEQKADKPAVKVDLDKCRTQVMAYVKEHGQTKGKELIESFGATKISDVAEDKLADLFVAAGGAL